MVTISEFYKNQDVFITGGTGFMGRVLIEKLLRSCPEIRKVYLLMRTKKGRDIHDRMKEITNLPLFDVLKEKNPENIKKLIPLSGDCMELGLGLSESDRQMLEENVSIVFHSAAHVRFDEALKYSIIMNTRGTRELMLLCRKMKKLKALVHISTGYCNCDRRVIEEEIYPAPVDWRKFIEVAENNDIDLLNGLTPKIIDKRPNTYVFTKALAEQVVKDLGKGLPAVIIRPSIVSPSWKEPIPGWIDNFNGPTGLSLAGAKGICRAYLGDPHIILDCVPVDVVIKYICIAAWDKGTSRDWETVTVCNITARGNLFFTMLEFIETGNALAKELPPKQVFWYPHSVSIQNNTFFMLNSIIKQVIPALVADEVLGILGKRKLLTAIQRQLFSAFLSLKYFMRRSWTFKNDSMVYLGEKVPESDAEFKIPDFNSFNFMEYLRDTQTGAYKFLLHDTADIYEAKKNSERMEWLDKIFRGGVLTTSLWAVYRSGILLSVASYIHEAAGDWITEIINA